MRRFVLPFVCVALLLAACSEPVSEDAAGPEIYRISCAPCHGNDLQGRSGPQLGGANAPSVDYDRAYFVQTVTRGRGRMPAFSGRLSDEQIERVVGFVLEQQGR